MLTTPAAAQQRYRVRVDENFRLEPDANATVLARVNAGIEVAGGERRNGWVNVTLEGWIWQGSTRASSVRGFDLAVGGADGENLRAEPNGAVLARLVTGAQLEALSRREGWVRVRRRAWMWERSLAPAGGAPRAADPPRPAAADTTPARSAPTLDQMALVPGARLHAAPDGDTLGVLGQRGTARVVARSEGWARVLVEAWVREGDLAPAADSALVGITGAEVRGGGRTYEGRLLRWTLQFIAVQTADELRRDIPAGQRFALMRGPLPEAGFVYVVLAPEQARAFERIEPLMRVTALVRVRTARSAYLGNPIVDLIAFAPERPQREAQR